jgi:ATPase subunit of ABC transporter with duplicated ATPase domains
MRVALARILLMRPDGMLLDEPSNHLDLESLIWLEDFLKNYEGALLMTSHDREFMNRIIGKVVEIDGGTLTTYSGNFEFYEQQRALSEKQRQAQFERQQAMLAKEIKFIERFKARASARRPGAEPGEEARQDREGSSRRGGASPCIRVPAGAALGRGRRQPEERAQGLWQQPIYDGLDFRLRRKERWCVLGANGAGKSTLLKLVAGSTEPDKGAVTVGAASRWAISHSMPWTCWTANETIFESLEDAFPQAGQGRAARAGRLLRLLRRRCREALPGAVGRREGAAGDGQDAVRSAELPGARRADQPSRHGHQGDAGQCGAGSEFEGTMLFVSATIAISSPRCRTASWS